MFRCLVGASVSGVHFAPCQCSTPHVRLPQQELMGKEDMARAVSTATAAAAAARAQVSAQVSSSQILSALTSNIIFNKVWHFCQMWP